jgi:putative transcriptional regulator
MLEPNDPVIESGDFLIATPAMRDANFHRTVILICDHDQQGTFGLVLNRSTGIPIEKVFEQLDPGIAETCSFFFGGPVDQERVFAVRRGVPDEVPGDEVGNGMFLPKDLAESVEQICSGDELLKQYRFFVGYSGWGAGQLEQELQDQSWITVSGIEDLIFDTEPDQLWSQALRSLGGEHTLWSMMPADPEWN